MKTKAAILVETGRDLEIGELEIPALKPGQVLVKIAYSGICHTQVLEVRGHRGKDAFLPHLLGHEGSGVVLEIGARVTKVKPDQKVLLSWIKGSGLDVSGSVYTWEGRKVNAGAITTFSSLSVISENRLTPLPDSIPIKEAALMGCAVPTGLGSVFNNAEAKAGQSLAVFGVGGVGLCAVSGAAIVGCFPIIAVDHNPTKLAVAQQLGATHLIDSSSTNLSEELHRLSPAGLDFVIEASGKAHLMEQALQHVKNLTGIAVLIGNAQNGEKISFDPRQFNNGKQLRGSWGGGVIPDRDFPRYFSLVESGKLNISQLLQGTYGLEAVNAALSDLESGKVVRPLLEMH